MNKIEEITGLNGEVGIIVEDKDSKRLVSRAYNYYFNKNTGFFARWGKTRGDDPDLSPFGPEIFDWEISTVCHQGCKFCYKCNTPKGVNLSFEDFKAGFHNLPRSLTQIAFGIGSIDGNPDLWKIMEYCRNNDYNEVVPNITINGSRMTAESYDKLAVLCGAVAVSHYDDDTCFNAVQELTDRGMSQVNIHQLLATETYEECLSLAEKIKTDPRLQKLNAVVFLALKPRGRGACMHPLKDTKKYKKLIDRLEELGVSYGMDSCSGPTMLKAVERSDRYKQYEACVEPCESTLFSGYANTEAEVFPCSFCEDGAGISLLEKSNFLREVWFDKKLVDFREKLLKTAKAECALVLGCRECPVYDLYERNEK